MILKIYNTVADINVLPNVARVVRVYNHSVPNGISESEFTQKGGILIGTGAGAFAEQTPGADGQYLKYDSTSPTGVTSEIPSVAIADPTNFLINGGFDFAQRQAPGTLTAISDNAYSADRWRISRENADLQHQRNDATSESGLTSKYYSKFKKITSAGKFLITQIIESANSIPLRGKTVIFQVKMKASTAKTIRMAVIELGSGGTIDTIPASIVSAWNVDSTDPTLGTNLAVITAVQSKSVTTAWQNFSVSVTVPATSKNLLCAVWSDADFSAADELNLAEAGLFLGASTLAWSPRHYTQERELCKRRCRKSYLDDIAPGTSVTNGHIVMTADATTSIRGNVSLDGMAGTPTISIYSVTGTANKVSSTAGADIGTNVVSSNSTANALPRCTDGAAPFTLNAYYLFHYIASIEL